MKPAAAHESKRAADRRPAAVLAAVKNTYPRQFRVGTAINDEQFAGFAVPMLWRGMPPPQTPSTMPSWRPAPSGPPRAASVSGAR